jgi:hypothetical protein
MATLLAAPAAFAQPRDRDPGEPWGSQAFRLLPWPWGSASGTPHLRSWVTGWVLTGSNPQAYEVRCENPYADCFIPLLRTRLNASAPLGNGSLTHTESAVPWRGRRVVLRAELRAGRIDGWGALWMRVDGPGDAPLAFDNMQNRPMRGTSAYEWYRVVLDVPPEAEKLSFGVFLHGPGGIFIRELQFEEAEADEASTDLMAPLQGKRQAQAPSTGSASPAAR